MDNIFHPDLNAEDVESLMQRIRTILNAAANDGIRLKSRRASERARKLRREINDQLGLRMLRGAGNDADLENAARACAHYAADAIALMEIASKSDGDLPTRWVEPLGRQVGEAFRSLAAAAILAIRAERPLRQYFAARRQFEEWREPTMTGNERDVLLEATIRLYEQGQWKTASEAARQIAPQIVKLAADLASRRSGRPLLRNGTGKPLEWIRQYRHSKLWEKINSIKLLSYHSSAEAPSRLKFNKRPPNGVIRSSVALEPNLLIARYWVCRLRDLNPRPTVYKTAALPLS